MPVLNSRSVLARNRKYLPLGDGSAGRVFGFGRYPYSFTPGAIPPDALAQQAMAILDSLPDNSGRNPIGTAQYPYPYPVPSRVVHIDTGYMGIAYDETIPATVDYSYYETHPVPDASGLIYWTGPDTAQVRAGLTQAQALAAQVLMSGGDTSWSADFHPASTLQTGGVYAPAETAIQPTQPLAVPVTAPVTTAPAPTTTTQPKAPTTAPTGQMPIISQVYSSNSVGGANALGPGAPVADVNADSLGGLTLPGDGGGIGSGVDLSGGATGSGVADIPWGLLIAGALGAAFLLRKR